MERRLFYEVTGLRFSAEDYRGEDSGEFNTENPPVKPAEEGLEHSSTRFLRPQVDPGLSNENQIMPQPVGGDTAKQIWYM